MPIGRADLSGGNNNEFSPSAEAIGEFKLQTGAIGAQYNGGSDRCRELHDPLGHERSTRLGFLLWPERSFQRSQSEHDNGRQSESEISRTQLRLFPWWSSFYSEDLRREK